MSARVTPRQPEGPYQGTVDEQVRAFYNRERLSPERARAMLEDAARRRAARRRHRLLAAAAILVVLAGAVLLRSVLEARALGDRVAAEVAMGHKKDLDVEIATSSHTELAESLHKLTFPLREPDRLKSLGPTDGSYELVGGRYCSIQAELAALLKYRDPRGQSATLYVTKLSAELDSLPGTQRSLDGMEVDVWSEQDLLFALVRDSAKPADP